MGLDVPFQIGFSAVLLDVRAERTFPAIAWSRGCGGSCSGPGYLHVTALAGDELRTRLRRCRLRQGRGRRWSRCERRRRRVAGVAVHARRECVCGSVEIGSRDDGVNEIWCDARDGLNLVRRCREVVVGVVSGWISNSVVGRVIRDIGQHVCIGKGHGRCREIVVRGCHRRVLVASQSCLGVCQRVQ